MEGTRNRKLETEASGLATPRRAGILSEFQARFGQVNDSIGNAESEGDGK